MVTPRYIYLVSELFSKTVIDSQMIEPLQQLGASGLVFDVIAATGIRPAWQERKWTTKRLVEIRAKLAPGKVWLHTLPLPNSVIGRAVYAACVLSHIANDVAHGRPIICHCRGHSTVKAALILKRILPRFRFIFDMRGDALAEAQTILGWEGRIEDWEKTGYYKKVKRLESQAIEQASQIICVSDHFRKKIAEEYPAAVNKVHTIPCVASQKLFYFDPSVRTRVRSDLHLTDSIVIVYAGSLEASWQIAGIMAQLFGEWRRRELRLHWLLVTHDSDIAKMVVEKERLGPDNVTIISADHENVAAYMMAGDVGLLLRRPDPINIVASPTKFAEYIMTGLPVLASAGIGDLDELFKIHPFGKLINDLIDVDHSYEQLAQVIQMPSDDNARLQRMMLARSLFSSEKVLEMRIKLYQSLLIDM